MNMCDSGPSGDDDDDEGGGDDDDDGDDDDEVGEEDYDDDDESGETVQFAKDQRWPIKGEPVCAVCGRCVFCNVCILHACACAYTSLGGLSAV